MGKQLVKTDKIFKVKSWLFSPGHPVTKAELILAAMLFLGMMWWLGSALSKSIAG